MGPDTRRAGRGRRRAPRRTAPRRLFAAGAAALAVALGVTFALRAGGSPVCAASAPAPLALAAPPIGGPYKGKATFYDSGGAGGNCSYPSAPADRRYVALGPTEYASAAACGGYLDVTGPRGTVRVLIMDQCPECPTGHLDLSAEAFARIADPVKGVVPVSYRAVVDPPATGPLTFRIKEGASQWWFAVLVGNHGTPLRSVEVRPAGGSGWRSAVRQDYNYWLVESGLGPGPYALRVTDVHGRQATATGIRLVPGRTQSSTARLGMRSTARPSASVRPTPPRGTPSARSTVRGTAVPAAAPATTALAGTVTPNRHRECAG